MSTDWHLYCVDCSEPGMNGGDNTNHWTAEMSALAREAPALADFALVVRRLQVGELTPYFHVDGSERLARPRIDLEWFLKHKGHKIVPRNEYGALLGECARSINCGTCGTQQYCTLPRDHPGECKQTRKRW